MRTLPCSLALVLLSVGCRSAATADPTHAANANSSEPATSSTSHATVPTGATQATSAQAADSTAAAAPSHLATYTDAKTGVSFQYPDVWQAAIPGSPIDYLGGEMPQQMGQPKAAFLFSTKGNVYEKTLLTSLSFSYYAAPRPNSGACEAPMRGNSNSTTAVTINGIAFDVFRSGDAAMCHRQASTIYVTYRQGVCYAFEGDTNTECPDAGDNKRPLTAAEDRALDRHMDDIFHSMRFSR